MTAAELHEILLASHRTIAVAESCTGGLLAAELTSIGGSSAYMQGGVVAYSNALKTSLLGVNAGLLTTHGAVSAEVAQAMAEGVRTACKTGIGVGITGVAGPGGSEAKPPGLIYVCATDGTTYDEIKLTENHGRSENRRQAVDAAMVLIARIAGRREID